MEVQSYSTPPSPKYPIHSPPSPVLIPSSLISQRVAESHVFMSEVNGHRCRDRLRLQEWCRVRCRSHTSPGSHSSRRLRTMSAPHFQLLSHHSQEHILSPLPPYVPRVEETQAQGPGLLLLSANSSKQHSGALKVLTVSTYYLELRGFQSKSKARGNSVGLLLCLHVLNWGYNI